MDIQKVLVASDFSRPATAALAAAADIAATSQATLTIAHAVPAESVIADAEVLARVERQIERGLAAQKHLAERRGASRVEVLRLEGLAWRAIVDEAVRGKYDLLVIGTHGRTGLRHVLIGSVAERVVRHAPCPVLVMRAPALARSTA